MNVEAEANAPVVEFLLHPVWSFVLGSRGQESFHACVVERDGVGLAVLGTSGTGKSSTGLAMINAGWRLVTDDLLAFDLAGRALVGPPFLRLDTSRSDRWTVCLDATGKIRYQVPVSDAPVPLGAIVVMDARYSRLARLKGVEAANALLMSVYVPILVFAGQHERRFNMALDLVQRVAVFGAPPRSLTVRALEKITMDH